MVEKSPDSATPPPKGGGSFVAKFIFMWLGSLIVLAAIALLANIEWVRPHLEDSLSSAFHRNVRLGRLSWALGFNGLFVETNKFVVREKNGQPFILSGPSEIGIAFLPLFEQKLIIKHLKFEKPEVWATKVGPKEWNFSDLLTEGPEIHLVQIEKGTLHLKNEQAKLLPGDWRAYNLQDIKLTLVVPWKERVWPVYFSCMVPTKDDKGAPLETKIRLSLSGQGAYEEWRKNKYSVELNLEKFNPQTFRPLLTSLPDLNGVWDFKFAAEGIFNEGLLATAKAAVNRLSVNGSKPGQTVIIPDWKGESKMRIDPKRISWDDLQLSMGRWAFKSTGAVNDWQKDSLQYEAKLGGRLTDLEDLFSEIITKFLPERKDKFSPQTVHQSKLAGSAQVELKLTGNHKTQNVYTSVKAQGLPLQYLTEASGSSALLSALKLEPNTPIYGELLVDQFRRIELKNVEMPMDHSRLKLSGTYDDQTKEAHFQFKAVDVSFDHAVKHFGDGFKTGLSLKQPYTVKGLISVDGSYNALGNNKSLKAQIAVKNVQIFRNGPNPVATNVVGSFDYDGNVLKIHNLKGTLPVASGPPGDFSLSGQTLLSGSEEGTLDLSGHRMDLVELRNLLAAFEIENENKLLGRISGQLQEFKTRIVMHGKTQSVSFSVNPADVYIGLKAKPGEPQQLHLNSGSIVYADNDLAIKDVSLVGRSGKILVSAFLSGALNKLVLHSTRIRSDGFELSEFNNLMRADFMPQSVSPSLPSVLLPKPASSLHGRIYGDLQSGFDPDNNGMSGIVGFNNAGGRFGNLSTPVEKLTGLVSVSRKQLILQDISGLVNKSTFSVDGIINDYQSSKLTWNGRLQGRFSSEELVSLTEQLGHGIHMSARDQDGLFLRMNGSGTSSNYRVLFNGRAEAGNRISLKTAFGTFTQPDEKPLTFDGSLSLKEGEDNELTLHTCSVRAGEDLIQAQGKFTWLSAESEKPASLQFSVKTPKFIPADTLLDIVNVTDEKLQNVGGKTSLDLSIDGPVNDLIFKGSCSFDKVTVPAFQIESLTGKIDMPNLSFAALNKPDAAPSQAQLKIDSVKFAGVVLKDASAGLVFVSKPSPRIVLDNGQASVSGGKLTVNGYMEQNIHRYHAQINVSKLIVDQFISDIIDRSGDVSGLGDLTMTIDTRGKTGDECIRNLSGSGKFNIYQGTVLSFGKLQEKLNGANLLQQGIFGFNVNNLLQTMLPVKTGQFKEISGNMQISKGILHFEEVRFDGNDIRLRAAGDVNLVERSLNMEIAGDIPRVTASIIPGPFGEMSRNFTLQRLFRVITFHKLKDLPALPLLGDLANDDPRSFTFNVNASLSQPKQLTQSVEKSFRWLANKPFASAHPVPGI
ncbi:MAG: AsmA-like C-terminal region-containing protein [Candidatus Obscuribacterales bacterium]|nr:AsmA-like C-terminal region-containing protein [Candidatus Obscuribacterales bacterium]